MIDRLDLADVEADAPQAVVDEGVPGQWPPLIDTRRLIPTVWRKLRDVRTAIVDINDRLQQARTVVLAQGDEINAIETELGVNPSGPRPTVAARLAAIEARLTVLETP